MLFEKFTSIANGLRGTVLRKIPGIEKTFNSIYKALEPSDCNELVSVGDFKMLVDVRDMGDVGTSLRKKHIYHPQMTKTIREVVRSGMVCVDVGANVGYFTLIMSKLVGARGRVYSFEPDQTNFNLLQKNLDLNDCYGNVLARVLAISNFYGEADLYVDKVNFGGHSLVSRGRMYSTRSVPVIPLDYLLKDKEVNFVKIDAEGADPEVLEGMEYILKSNKDISLIVEYLPRIDSGEHLDKLASKGFRFFYINETQKATFPITPFLIEKLWRKEVGLNLLVRRV